MKKIIAMILAIAMTVSMFTMVFSGEELVTSAKTNYSAKVEQLKDLLNEVLEVGPHINPDLAGIYTDGLKYWVNNARYVGRGSASNGISGIIGELADMGLISEDNYTKEYEEERRDISYYISDEDAFMAAMKKTLASISFAFKNGISADGEITLVATSDRPRFDMRSEFKKDEDQTADEYDWTTGKAGKNPELVKKDDSFEYSAGQFLAWLAENGKITAEQADITKDVVETGIIVPDAYSDAQLAIGYVVLFAGYAVRFGTDADSELFSTDFNANRTKIYDLAINALATLLAALKAQVTANVQPAAYAAELPAYVDFATENEEYYNSSYGINPYIYLGVTDDLGSILGINLGYRWYTFEEIQANAEWAALLADFQLKLRAAKSFKVAGVLYSQFAAARDDLYESFEELCWAIVGKQAAPAEKDYTYLKDTVVAVTQLWAVVDFVKDYIAPNFDLYSKTAEVSAAIWTLKGQMQFAETVLEHLEFTNATETFRQYVAFNISSDKSNLGTIDLSKMLYVDVNSVNTLVANIKASIAKLVPSYGQELTAADVEKGIDLYKKAQAIYNYMTDIAGKDDAWNEQVALITILNKFDMLLPYAAGENVVATIDNTYVLNKTDWVDAILGTADARVPNIYGQSKITVAQYKADVAIEYAPVAFAYLSALAELEEAYENYLEAIKNETTSAPTYGLAEVTELFDVMKRYDFLYWTYLKIDGVRIDSSPETPNYFYALTGYAYEDLLNTDVVDTEDFVLGGFLGIVLCDTTSSSSEQNVYDYATRNFLNFFTIFDNAYEISHDWDEMEWSYDYGENGKIDFSEGFDILDVIVSDGASILDELIEQIQAAAKLLCVNYTKVIVMYDWVLEQIEETMNITLADEAAVVYTYNKDAAPDAADWSIAQNYTEGNFKALVAAMTVLKQQIARYHDVTVKGETVNVKEMVTLTDLEASYANVKAALYALLTAKGAAAMDTFFEAVDDAFTVNYSGVNYNNPAHVKTVLDNYVDEIVDYFPAVVLARPYDYFAYTLNTIAHYDNAGNIYYATGDVEDSPFELNFYNAFAKAVAKVESVVTGQYAYAAREKAAKLHYFANDILSGMGSAANIYDDDDNLVEAAFTFDAKNWNVMNMPLWYAQELTAYLNNFVAVDAAAQSAAALAVKKAADLDPLIAEANAIQTGVLSAGVANNFIKAYEAAKKVSVNGDGKVLYIYSAEEIDAAALALRNALVAVYDEIGEAVYTLEDILAKVDAVVATATARAEGSAIDVSELVAFATNVKQQISTNYGAVSQRTQINTVVTKANKLFDDAMKAAGVSDQFKAVKAAKAEYTTASYEAYVAAKEALDAVADVNAETADTYATAKAAYDAAYNALLKIADAETAAYLNAVEVLAAVQAKLADKDAYTAESYAKLEAAVAALQAAVDSYASDADLQAAIVTVKVAEAMLETAPVKEVGTLDD